MISIITPTHDPRFLRELETTILSQTYKDWEWIVLLNGGAKYEPLHSDERIKITECPFVNNGVGFLKRLACMQATGEVIAEVDHDDLLTADCLIKVAAAFEDKEVGFVYSENAKLSKDFRPYLEEYGWTHKFFSWKGRKLYAMNNQPLYPARLGQIWFAPDHIRAWRRDVYEKIGGHNDSLKVCDDLDLMQRLYLETKFKEIPEVLYVYRINGENTFISNGKQIREKNNLLYAMNIENLCRRFCMLNGLAIIDLSKDDETLSNYPDGSAGLIIAKDYLQYLAEPRQFMNEVHRVLAYGGMLLSDTPSTDGRGAFQDPKAASFWNENSFWYYTRKDYAAKIKNTKLFRVSKLVTEYPDDKCKEHKVPYVTAHLEKI